MISSTHRTKTMSVKKYSVVCSFSISSTIMLFSSSLKQQIYIYGLGRIFSTITSGMSVYGYNSILYYIVLHYTQVCLSGLWFPTLQYQNLDLRNRVLQTEKWELCMSQMLSKSSLSVTVKCLHNAESLRQEH